MPDQVFVGRQTLLAKLFSFLDQALAGHGQVGFVVGEAGAGKTALLVEFARLAQEAHNGLVFVVGNCNAQTGIGDAYLPFREILAQFTGDFESRLTRGAFAAENTRRLSSMTRWSFEVLVEFGPDLINTLIPGVKLLTRAGTFVAKKAGWLEKLQRLVESRVGVPSSTAVEQSRIFEQVTNVFKALAVKKPLVLVLDDLHWADAPSASLLFHLGRRVEGSRILVLGAYRPEEVELGRGGERHPLEKVLAEFKRYLGDVWVDLNQAQKDEARPFADALLDLEPNRLGEGFREALVQHTGGHPLFAVELLHAMQEHGELQKDAEGRWVEAPGLDWDELPPRVEGVIEERIGRLEGPLQAILKVGSVEGETFTAEVIARVQHAEDRAVVAKLSQELDQRHQLVRALGIRRLRAQALSSYRFRHNLFQMYLYNSLDPAERAYLHQDVGQALETLYGDDADDIALQLAWHYEEAAFWDKAVFYWGRAGEQACQRYVNEQAIAHFGHALALLQDHPDAAGPRGTANLYEGLGDVLILVGQSEQARSAFQGALTRLGEDDRVWMARLERKIGKTWERQRHHPEALRAYDLAEGMLGPRAAGTDREWWHEFVAIQVDRIWTTIWYRGAYAELSELAATARPAVEQFGTPAQRASFFRSLVLMNDMPDLNGADPSTESYALAAVAASEESGDQAEVAQSLYYLGYFHAWFQGLPKALDELQQALTLAERIGDPYLRLECLVMLASFSRVLGKAEEARRFTEQSLPLANELESVEYKGSAYANLAWLAWRDGNDDEARRYADAAMNAWRSSVDLGWHRLSLWLLVPIALSRGEVSTAIDYARRLLESAQRPVPNELASVLEGAVAAWNSGNADAARAFLEQANGIVRKLGYL